MELVVEDVDLALVGFDDLGDATEEQVVVEADGPQRVHRDGGDPLAGCLVVDFLLSPDFARPHYDRLVDEFSAASYEDAEVRKHLRRLFATLEEFTVSLLLKAVSEAPPERVR